MNTDSTLITPASLTPNLLLSEYGLDTAQLSGFLSRAMSEWADYGDIFLQSKSSEFWALESGAVKRGDFQIDQGCGLRAMRGDDIVFSTSQRLDPYALKQTADKMRMAVPGASSARRVVLELPPAPAVARYSDIDPLSSLDAQRKVELLKRIDALARRLDSRVVSVLANFRASHEIVWVVRSDGHIASDVRPQVALSMTVYVEQNGCRESANSGIGRRDGYAIFDEVALLELVERVVSTALLKLDAIPAPAGTMDLVLGPGWNGVLLHEAVGHGLEGDFNRRGASAYAGRIGERVAAPGVTIVDDGTVANGRGSLTIDDEGWPTQCTTLIDDGILRGYMQDSLNARLMGMTPTGNGRRESYAALPMPRMTNTYMLGGEFDPAEIVASVKDGLYIAGLAGGQVDISSGRFVFAASEAFLIENGRCTAPVKGATVVGNGPETLRKVVMIGNDLELDPGIAVCGKAGQSVLVSVGQPTLRIDGMTVGGTG